MVFENLTLFEVHFEDATFGPTLPAGEDESRAEETSSDDESEDGGLPVKRLLVASVVVSIVVALLARKLAGEDVPDVSIDAPDEPVDVSVED